MSEPKARGTAWIQERGTPVNTTVRTSPHRNPGPATPGDPRPRPGRPRRAAPGAGPAQTARPATGTATDPPARTATDLAARTVASPAVRATAVRAAPSPAASPATGTAPARPAGAAPRAASAGSQPVSRTPFILLVLGLLGGGLVCLLVINTTLAAGSFRISALQQSNAQASQRVEELQQQVATEESPASIEQRALRLGLRMQPVLNFLDLRTGRSYAMPTTAPGVSVAPPGYTP
jgi:hypothetical protein